MALTIEGEEKVSAPIESVWRALNDVDVLRQCLPGCESLEKTADDALSAKVSLKIGPIKAVFTGDVTLSNFNPPFSYTITGAGKGGIAGFAKGGADVVLTPSEDGTTLLKYASKVDVGGKIAQLGGRLILATSKKLTEEFFSKFNSLASVQGASGE
jgi:uncharacterized protein